MCHLQRFSTNIFLYLSRVFWGRTWPWNPPVLRERPRRCTLVHTWCWRRHMRWPLVSCCRCSWSWCRTGRLCSCTGRGKSASTHAECCSPCGRVSRWMDNTHLREVTHKENEKDFCKNWIYNWFTFVVFTMVLFCIWHTTVYADAHYCLVFLMYFCCYPEWGP